MTTLAFNLPLTARMALLRASLTVYDFSEVDPPMSTLMDQIPLEIMQCLAVDMPEYELSLLLGPTLNGVIKYCSSSQQPSVQLFAVQTLESLLSAQEDVLLSSNNEANLNSAHHLDSRLELRRLLSISSVLMVVWRHPSKVVNHVASSVYRKLLDTLARYIQCKNIIDSNTVVWLPALADTLKQPVQHRSRYHAITLQIPRVGAQTIVANEPTIFTHLIDVMRMREVSSSCCSCICALLKNLVSEEEMDVRRRVPIPSV